jgi:hypothetical protein
MIAVGLEPEGKPRTIVEADDVATLDAMLHRAGLATHPAVGDRRLVEAEPEAIARLAIANDVVLRRLAPAEDGCVVRTVGRSGHAY